MKLSAEDLVSFFLVTAESWRLKCSVIEHIVRADVPAVMMLPYQTLLENLSCS